MILKINDIKPGRRVRDEYGDMESLANSIKEHGLLHPIVVDSDYNLIAGGRRLLACERIGMKEIEAKVLEDISERELRVLELEENIRRKDLTELEKSKNLVELAEIKELEARENELMAESATNSAGAGRPKDYTSIKSISEDLNIPRKTLHDAKQHVAAVEEFPPLADLPKYKAIETAKELRQAPPEEQEKILDLAQQRKKKDQNYDSYLDECGRLAQSYNKALYSFLRIKADETEFKMVGEVIAGLMNGTSVDSYLREVDDTIAKLGRIRQFLKGVKR